MRVLTFICLTVFIVSCNSLVENDTNTEGTPFVFDIVEPSEMSLLMKHMLEENDKIKKQIIKGEIPNEFPDEILKIYTAEMTETKYRTEIFEAYSKVYVDNEKTLFDMDNELPLIEKYNNAINTCIACHKTECVGPIPRIRKLLIN